MANAVYPKYRTICLSAPPDLSSVAIKVVMVDAGAYTYSASHEFLSDIPVGARVATSIALTSKTLGVVGDGVFDAGDVTITAVTGPSVEALVLIVDTGSAATSRLLCYMDSAVDGLPYTPPGGGGSVTISWASGGIFQL